MKFDNKVVLQAWSKWFYRVYVSGSWMWPYEWIEFLYVLTYVTSLIWKNFSLWLLFLSITLTFHDITIRLCTRKACLSFSENYNSSVRCVLCFQLMTSSYFGCHMPYLQFMYYYLRIMPQVLKLCKYILVTF